jgi:hypothetical protein
MSRRLEAERLLPRTFVALAALALAVALLALWSGPAEAATTFTVNKTGDAKDRRISDTRCDSSPDRGNQCTLRAAIQESNDTTGADTINFNIVSDASVKTIKPAKPLPEITEAVTINGYSQGSATTTTSDDAEENTLAEGNDAILKIQLNGTNAGSANGLVIEAADSTIKGLVINRFAGNGVLLSGSGATGNNIEGNFIGTNAAGSADLGNGDDGVDVFGADDNTIGGTAAGARNLISGNSGDGVQIVGGLGTTGNEILGNYIGTDKNGTSALGNSEEGVLIFSVSDNTVGGTTAGARNVISGNNQDGVQISGNASIGVATGNQVLGNFIGTRAIGSEALANTEDGVDIFDARVNTVGGTASGAGNVISGNQDDGVEISGNLSTDNQVLGNFVGTDENGTADLGNGNDGVEISSGADNNTIGGTATGARNIISGNGGDGVQIIGGLLATGNEVLGNFIGTNATGNAALGNSGEGVEISQAEDNTIGGTTAAARNIISGNVGDGVVIFGSDATGNKVQGNFIGSGVSGNALGNDDGVAISSGNDSTIGSAIGSTAGGNRIAHNDQDGVLVFGGLAVGNSVLSNSIFSNGETGIDLGGGTEDAFEVTANDEDDPDATTPASNNHRQNFPVITSAIRSNTTNFTTIQGTLNSNPAQNYTIQCFVAAPDPSGHGEGQILVAQTTATTDSGGDDSFACVSPVPQAGQVVTATATNTSGTASGTSIGDTSEFSENETVVLGP